MGEIKVSVIVPVYNVEKYLEECVESLLGQTLKEIEILLIDDGSTDSSGDICERYAQQYGNISIIHKENGGQGSARNVGILNVQGKYVYYMDSDDILEKDALQFLYDEAEKAQLDVILFSAVCFSEEAELEYNPDEYQRTKLLNEVMSGEKLFAGLYTVNEYYCSIPMRFYNKEYLLDNKFIFPESIIHEDELYGFFSLIQAKNAECIPQQFYKRRFRKGSTMTGKKAYRSAMGYVYTWKELMDFYKKTKSEYRNVYWSFAQSFLKLVINLYCKSFEKNEKKTFAKVRREMQDVVKADFKKLDKGMQLFLAEPFLYEKYRKITETIKEDKSRSTKKEMKC